ncbi:MAG: hypothetical protein KC940_06850 [Candidatus Omnitrophica bacterium]|nr:hypothetical protein [Candidatus Omnitrophota bacterium]MCA9430206.1 hypothetical protein [Candidatus Omnitrophota bacterium]MCA9436678.1 hypothetical protein [Candidatus Omnitrophota bacterium]
MTLETGLTIKEKSEKALEKNLSPEEIKDFKTALSGNSSPEESEKLRKGLETLFANLKPSEALEWIETMAPGAGDSLSPRLKLLEGMNNDEIIANLRRGSAH